MGHEQNELRLGEAHQDNGTTEGFYFKMPRWHKGHEIITATSAAPVARLGGRKLGSTRGATGERQSLDVWAELPVIRD